MEKLIKVSTSGLMNGYFTSYEVDLLVRYLSSKYPSFVSGQYVIGNTFLGKPIVAFSLGRLKGRISFLYTNNIFYNYLFEFNFLLESLKNDQLTK